MRALLVGLLGVRSRDAGRCGSDAGPLDADTTQGERGEAGADPRPATRTQARRDPQVPRERSGTSRRTVRFCRSTEHRVAVGWKAHVRGNGACASWRRRSRCFARRCVHAMRDVSRRCLRRRRSAACSGPAATGPSRWHGASPGCRTSAQNGQYLGLFQMGSYERRLFGHGGLREGASGCGRSLLSPLRPRLEPVELQLGSGVAHLRFLSQTAAPRARSAAIAPSAPIC